MNVTTEHMDTLVLGLPAGNEVPVDPARDRELQEATMRAVAMQFEDAVVRPTALVLTGIEWLLAQDHATVDTFVPRHDCELCATAISKAHEFLEAHPGGTAAMANVSYLCSMPVPSQGES